MRAELLTLACLGAAVGAAAHEPEPSRYSYHRDIAPILARHCTGCHSEGGVGPMSLTSYRDIRPWGAAVRREVLERRMPPWQPEEGLASLVGARLLSAREMDVLADWVTGAMPEGDADVVGEAQISADGAAEAAHVVVRGAAVRIPADEPEWSHCVVFAAAPASPGAAAVTRLRFGPGNLRVVRRAVIWAGGRCDNTRAPLAAWVPGQADWSAPDGAGQPLADGFAARIEYRKRWEDDGLALEDASALQLWLGAADRPLRRVLLADASLELDREARLLGWSGTRTEEAPLRLHLREPSGARHLVFEVRAPDPLWLGRYAPEQPIALPAGATLEVSGGELALELDGP